MKKKQISESLKHIANFIAIVFNFGLAALYCNDCLNDGDMIRLVLWVVILISDISFFASYIKDVNELMDYKEGKKR